MNKKIHFITFVCVFSTLSFILYSLEISIGFILPQAAFLKIDFSDLPAFLITLLEGFKGGFLVALIKNIMHISITKEVAFSGEIANFFACLAYLIPLCFYNRKDDRNKIIIYLIISTILLTLVMSIVNYYITLPLYGINGEVRLTMLLSTFLPFNLIKGIILGICVYLIYPVLNLAFKMYNK